jgi:acyl carrier protein
MPPYPFTRKRYWIPAEDHPEPAPAQPELTQADERATGRAPAAEPAALRLAVERELRRIATRFLQVAEQEVDADTDLLELGFDSMSLVQLVGELVENYEVDIDETVDAVLFEHLSLAALADHVEKHHRRQAQGDIADQATSRGLCRDPRE